VYSAVHGNAHEIICPYMPIPCALSCQKFIPRGEMQSHVTTACPLRPVPCPFSSLLGCDVPLVSRDVASHCEEYAHKHLLDACIRLQSMSSKIGTLCEVIAQNKSNAEATAGSLRKGIEAASAASVAGLAGATEEHNSLKKEVKLLRERLGILQDDVKASQSTITKLTSELKETKERETIMQGHIKQLSELLHKK